MPNPSETFPDFATAAVIEMYQDYIDGKRELREINAEFNARYVSGAQGPEKNVCGMIDGGIDI